MSRHGRSQPDGYDNNHVGRAGAGAAGYREGGAGLATLSFLPHEWDLLVHLPAQVMIAATSAEADSARRTVVEGLAGIDAIAGGRSFDSDLVRAVVAAIYAEPDEASRAPAGQVPDRDIPVAEEFTDRAKGIAKVLANCRSATALLATRADPADSAAYRQWLQSIAARVCQAARSGGVPSLGGERVSEAERRFLGDLGAALGLA